MRGDLAILRRNLTKPNGPAIPRADLEAMRRLMQEIAAEATDVATQARELEALVDDLLADPPGRVQ